MPFSLSSFRQVDRNHPSRTRWIRICAAISIGNLCYLRMWDLVLYDPERDYLVTTYLSSGDYLAAILGALLFAALTFGLISVVWYSRRRAVRAAGMAALLVLLLFPLDFLRRSLGLGVGTMRGTIGLSLMVLGLITLLWAAGRFRQQLFAVLLWIFALAAPYAALNIGTAIYRAVTIRPVVPRENVLPTVAVGAPTKLRVVWVIFDEWDEVATFERRPPGLQLPVIDQFAESAFMAVNAFPPGGKTLISLPALLSGQRLDGARIADRHLEIRTQASGAWRNFADVDNLITTASCVGRHSAIVGWYHPYERLFGSLPEVTARGTGLPKHQGYRRGGLLGNIVAQLRELLDPSFDEVKLSGCLREVHAEGMRAIEDPVNNFIFVHYGIPHLPGLYQRKVDQLRARYFPSATAYYANLERVDNALGDLLSGIGRERLGTRTAVILSSDHWWRSAPWLASERDHRVPLIIWIPDGGPPISYSKTLCTVDVAKLVPELLDGRVSSYRELARWFDRNAGPVPQGYRDGNPVW